VLQQLSEDIFLKTLSKEFFRILQAVITEALYQICGEIC